MDVLTVSYDDYGNISYSSMSPISASIELIQETSPFTFIIIIIVLVVGVISIGTFIYKKLKKHIQQHKDIKHYEKVKDQIQNVIDEQIQKDQEEEDAE